MLLFFYNLLIHLALPFFLVFSLTRPKIRRSLVERIFPSPLPESAKIWIHAASVGEAVLAEALIRYLYARGVPGPFLVTTNTYYTRDLLRKKSGLPLVVASLPFDLPFSLGRFLGRSRLDVLILIETELWPNLINCAKRRNIAVVVVNGRISDSTVGRYRALSFFLRHVLSPVDRVLAQSSLHADRFRLLGVMPERVFTTGNMKYYREMEVGENSLHERKAVTFGSIKEKEIEAIRPAVATLFERFPELTLYVAPRELSLVEKLESSLSFARPTGRYSAPHGGARIIIVDTVGDLVRLYGRSLVAFVGGSLAPYGGQNMLEPLFFKTPVLFGPYTENFSDIAREIIERGAGLIVRDGDQLAETLLLLLGDHGLRARMGEAGGAIVEAQKKVMSATFDLLKEYLWRNSPGS